MVILTGICIFIIFFSREEQLQGYLSSPSWFGFFFVFLSFIKRPRHPLYIIYFYSGVQWLVGSVCCFPPRQRGSGIFCVRNASPWEVTVADPVKRVFRKNFLGEEKKDKWHKNVPNFALPTIPAVVQVQVKKVPGTNPHEQEGDEVKLAHKKVLDSSSPTPSSWYTISPLLSHKRWNILFRNPHNTDKLQQGSQEEIDHVPFHVEFFSPRPSPIGQKVPPAHPRYRLKENIQHREVGDVYDVDDYPLYSRE